MYDLDITFVKSILYKRIVSKFFLDYCINSRVCNYGKRPVIGLLRVVIKCFIFIYLYLNVNEWIPVKGCIEVVSSNSVSMGSCDIVLY